MFEDYFLVEEREEASTSKKQAQKMLNKEEIRRTNEARVAEIYRKFVKKRH